MSKHNSSTSGIGFMGMLGLIFITLKLTGFINWSWWYVLMPIYIPISIGLIILAIVLIIYFKNQ